jgi:transcriptional regulator with XRE-family HTH domain/predicted negative regulator of RcsB-dependent stress response
MEFGPKLRELRERAGLTQYELAEGIAASSFISLLEAGKRKPKSDLIIKLALRLGIPVEELVIDQSVQERELNLNTAKVALSSGDLEVAEDFAHQVLKFGPIGLQDAASLSASVVLLQANVRRGLFEGVLDELEQLFKDYPKAAPDLRSRIANEIIRVCFRSGNLALGVQRGEALLMEYATVWPEIEIVELMVQLAACHYHRGDTPRATEIIGRALKLAEKCKSPKALVQSHWQASTLASHLGDLTLALSHISQAIHWSKLAELHQVLPILNDNAAKWMLDMPNPDLDRIHDLAESAYLDLASQNNPRSAAYTCITLSEVEMRKGNFDKALMYVRKGLAELPPEIPGPKASLFSQEAKILFRLGKVDESFSQLDRAMEHMRTMPPDRELATHWGEIARVFVDMDHKDLAIYAYEQAIAVGNASQAEQNVLAEVKL